MPAIILSMLLKPLINMLIEIVIMVLKNRAADTKSKVDDHTVEMIEREKGEIKRIARSLAKEKGLIKEAEGLAKKADPPKGIFKHLAMMNRRK